MSDYLFMLENRLAKDQIQLIAQVQRAAEHAQMRLFLAGGAVRDLLGGARVRDLDFAVEGPALKLVRQLEPRLFTVLSTDEDRQSVELVFGDTATAEISMCRSERYHKTGGEPEITRSTIQDDLFRRDFSVNALAISLNPVSRGLLVDPTNGLADIERKELRVLHNYSFFDDPTRLLRLVRFRTRLGYSIEERTNTQFNSAREAAVADYLSPRSRLIEMRQLAAEPETADVVKALQAAGLLEVFEPHLGKKLDLPSLAKLDKCRKVIADSGQWVDNLGPFLHTLTRKLSPAERTNLQARLGLRASDARAWTDLERRAKDLQKALTSRQAALNSGVYRLLFQQDPAVALFLLTFWPLKPVREKIRTYFSQLRPLARSIEDKEIEQATGIKRDSPKFAAARESYLLARLDKKPAKEKEPPPPAPGA